MDFTMKKILVINHPSWTPRIEIGVVVGADPEIGICVASPNDLHNPWIVLRGPLDPECAHNGEELEVNNFALDQIRSGYISVEVLADFIENRGRYINTSGTATCPYSM